MDFCGSVIKDKRKISPTLWAGKLRLLEGKVLLMVTLQTEVQAGPRQGAPPRRRALFPHRGHGAQLGSATEGEPACPQLDPDPEVPGWATPSFLTHRTASPAAKFGAVCQRCKAAGRMSLRQARPPGPQGTLRSLGEPEARTRPALWVPALLGETRGPALAASASRHRGWLSLLPPTTPPPGALAEGPAQAAPTSADGHPFRGHGVPPTTACLCPCRTAQRCTSAHQRAPRYTSLCP